MIKVNVAKIQTGSMVDGPGGPRTVVWFQGCGIRCPGCQNKHLWPSASPTAQEWGWWNLAGFLYDLSDEPVTITGGEPFDQPHALNLLTNRLKDFGRHVIVYTGYTLGQLVEQAGKGWIPDLRLMLESIDILVTGPYDPCQDSEYIQWRGSANQLPIDCQALLEDFEPSTWPDHDSETPTVDWDTPTIEVIGGVLYATGGILSDLQERLEENRMLAEIIPRCGEAT